MKLTTYSDDGQPIGLIRFPDAAICTIDVEAVPEPDTKYVLTLRVGLRNGPLSASISPYFATREEALAELDRIAALIEDKAPTRGWVAGAPPKDGKWYLAGDFGGEPVAVRFVNDASFNSPWRTADGGFDYSDEGLRCHLPTPIQPPKES